MLLPIAVVDVKTTFGRCYCQVVDGIATFFFVTGGRCYCLVADVITTIGCVFGLLFAVGRWNSLGSIFNLSSEVLNRTSSHMCSRWNLPTFLFRGGLLTLMNKASLIALLRFWSSLPTMLKLSILMS